MKIALFLVAVSIFSRACGPTAPKQAAEGFGTTRSADLIIEPSQTDVAIEWGTPYEIPVTVSWKSGQKYAVQIAPAADSPSWLLVETRPVILDPPGTMYLIIEADAGVAQLGKRKITFEASAYGLANPVKFDINLQILRQNGNFEPVLASQQSLECRNICGKVAGGRLSFYDLLKEKGQDCEDALPETQRIGTASYGLADKGYGYGRTCRVAAMYESNGNFSFVNLGYYQNKVPRGNVFMSLRGVDNCWLSSDNTIALVQYGTNVTPYDVMSGNQLGEPQRMSDKITGANFIDGSLTVSGSSSYSTLPSWIVE